MKKFAVIVCLYLFCFYQASAQPLIEGTKLTPFKLTNQFEQNSTIDATTRLILFSREKSTANLVEQAYQAIPVTQRHGSDIVFISDISKMPGFISRFVALPALRDKDYTVLLDRDGELTRNFPTQNGKVTLIFLDASMTVRRISFTDSIEDLKKLLDEKPIEN